jgi:glycerophosphoryl diester phosphodiesterase
VRNHIRTLCAVIVALIALVFTAQVADADSMEEITVAHRGAATSQLGEGTLPAYSYAVKNHADMLDGDVRWTKDGPDADNLGTMVILHDATLDRITNCRGTVSSWLWSAIRDRCRTKVGDQRLMRLVDLLRYGNSVGKSFALEIKVSLITDAQAKQLWNAIKNSRVQLQATSTQLAALDKIRKLDVADPNHRLSYALIALGTNGWPSASAIKKVGTAVHAKLTIPADVARSYREAGIKVFLFTSKNDSDDARMIALHPYAVVVNDVGRFQRWRDAASGSA